MHKVCNFILILILLILVFLLVAYVCKRSRCDRRKMVVYSDTESPQEWREDFKPQPIIGLQDDYTSTQKAILGPEMFTSHATWAEKFKDSKMNTGVTDQRVENPLFAKYQSIAGGRRPVVKFNPNSDQIVNDVTAEEVAEYNNAMQNRAYTF